MAANGAVGGKSASSKDIAVVLCILPFVQMSQSLYIYSCLPLHMVENGLDLLSLGIFSGLALCTRTFVPIVAARFVALEKLLIPSFALALSAGILNCVFTDEAVVLYLNIYCVMLLPTRCVFQAAGLKVWPSDHVKALRLYEGFYTLGYCMSSLWGATIYTIGGWQLCIWCQVGILALSLALSCTVRELLPVSSQQCKLSSGEATDQTKAKSSSSTPNETEMVVTEHQDTHDGWWYLALFVCIGSGIAIFAYASEWAIYLVFLTDRFDMSVLVIGIGQMSGDIGGAMILMTSMLTGKRLSCTAAETNVTACGACLCSLPWSMVWLGAIFALAFIFFLSPEMELAVVGQVMMGTMYVLLQQGCSELVEWCSRCGKERSSIDAETQQRNYQRYAAMADACFCSFCCLGSVVPFIVMENLSTEWVCYIAAGLVSAYAVAFFFVFLGCGRGEQEPPAVSVQSIDDRKCTLDKPEDDVRPNREEWIDV